MRSFLISLCLCGSVAFAQEGPPKDPKATRAADLVELVKLEPTIKLDIRYAGSNNFLGKPVYKEARAFLQRPAAEALLAAHKDLARSGYGLMIHDGYRPWAITKLFWDMTTGFQREFVADPKTGSKHNRGCALDMTLVDLKTGNELAMPTPFDTATEESWADAPVKDEIALKNRELLKSVMAKNGFTVEPSEWWHYNFNGWKEYPLMDIPFDILSKTAVK